MTNIGTQQQLSLGKLQNVNKYLDENALNSKSLT